MKNKISNILIEVLFLFEFIPFAAQAYGDEKPQKMEDGTDIIYSSAVPKWVPPQLDTLLPDWMHLDASWTAQPVFNLSGGSGQTSSYADQWGLNLTLSSGMSKKDSKKSEFDRWSLHGNLGLLKKKTSRELARLQPWTMRRQLLRTVIQLTGIRLT